MTTKKEISSLIEAYLSNDISLSDKNKLLELISSNKFIAREFIVRQRINKAIQKKDIMEVREQLNSLVNVRSKTSDVQEPKQAYYASWYKIAAVIILLATVGYLTYLQFGDSLTMNHKQDHSSLQIMEKVSSIDNSEPKKDNGEMSIQESSKGQEITKSTKLPENEMLAFNFDESAYYESFINNYRSYGIQIEMPLPGSTFDYSSEIQFKWKGDLINPIELLIMNNREELVCQAKVISEFTLKIPLDRGLYYWKIESEEDLLYLNKFYIK